MGTLIDNIKGRQPQKFTFPFLFANPHLLITIERTDKRINVFLIFEQVMAY